MYRTYLPTFLDNILRFLKKNHNGGNIVRGSIVDGHLAQLGAEHRGKERYKVDNDAA